MEILETTVDGVGISVEASTNSIRSLLGVLTSGMAFTKERGNLVAHYANWASGSEPLIWATTPPQATFFLC